MAYDPRLGDAFVFDEVDLAANRAGELSPDQALIRRNTVSATERHGRRSVVMVVIAAVAAAVSVVMVVRATPGAGVGTLLTGLGIVAALTVVLTVLARRNRVLAAGMARARLAHVEGAMDADWEAMMETYVLIVGGVRFRVDRLQYESVTPGARYAVHYLEGGPHGPWLLSLERLEDA